ncbi:hypothetical protein [Hutsoniella sourekii]|uniref:hypothetical protein n=1 Tax=Hutsoniella sourekii TaxID=87650 RepID=UPI0004816E90|nr:hypothetical protein [Hutsoniella sourekii]
MKTKLTKRIESALYFLNDPLKSACALEVKIGRNKGMPDGSERVDFISMDTDGTIRAYEIKVSKSDLHSSASLSFVGDYNYLVMPEELYDKVKDDSFIRELRFMGIGMVVYDVETDKLETVKRAKKKVVDVGERMTICWSMMRSLYREVNKWMILDNENN